MNMYNMDLGISQNLMAVSILSALFATPSCSSLAPAKLKEYFLKMHGDGKYKNTTLA